MSPEKNNIRELGGVRDEKQNQRLSTDRTQVSMTLYTAGSDLQLFTLRIWEDVCITSVWNCVSSFHPFTYTLCFPDAVKASVTQATLLISK